MDYRDLLLEKADGIATITLNRPEKLIALSLDMRMSLAEAAVEVDRDDDVRVVILTGAGRGFCSGADVGGQAARLDGTAAEVSRYERFQVTGWPYSDAFPRMSKPVIAAVNGVCVGAGFSVALSCDIRIASESARFGTVQVARALVPDAGATFYLPYTIGVSRAMELMFTGDIIGAAEAERLGIVSRVAAADELMKVTQELAARIAQQAPVSIGLTKRMVWRSLIDSIARQLDLETWAQNICRSTEDHRESVRAFLEKLPTPEFKGR